MIELESGTRLVGYVAGAPNQPLLMSTDAGYGFACTVENLLSRQKGGKQFITVDEGALPLRPALVDPANDDRIACLSEKGRLLVFAASEIKAQSGGGRGVTLMGLDAGEKMVDAVVCGKTGLVVTGSNRAGKPVENAISGAELKSHEGHRARKGTLLKGRLKDARLKKRAPPRDEG
jgi:topoisomerase-4 subunit A